MPLPPLWSASSSPVANGWGVRVGEVRGTGIIEEEEGGTLNTLFSIFRNARDAVEEGASSTGIARARDGQRLFVGCWDGRCYCLRAADGCMLWRSSDNAAACSGVVQTTPALCPLDESRVFYGSSDQCVRAVRAADGAPLWETPELGGDIYSSPVVSACGQRVV